MAHSQQPWFGGYDPAYRGDLGPRDDRPYLADEEGWWPEYDADFREQLFGRRWRSRDFAQEPWETGPGGRERRMYARRRSDRLQGRESDYYPGHRVPRDFRRYLSPEEYGLGESGYGRDYAGGAHASPRRARHLDRLWARRGPDERNALFGGQGFRRYDRDYDER